jgi:phage-related minor tail protein
MLWDTPSSRGGSVRVIVIVRSSGDADIVVVSRAVAAVARRVVHGVRVVKTNAAVKMLGTTHVWDSLKRWSSSTARRPQRCSARVAAER